MVEDLTDEGDVRRKGVDKVEKTFLESLSLEKTWR
jgi:hypothetical protein